MDLSTAHRPLQRAVALVLLATSAMVVAPDARAEDWPVFRHDARRTAASAAVVPIDRPAPLFRTYLGGSLGVTQFMDMDVDGDGRFELVYVSGGRVVAKRGDNLAVWESDIVPVDTMWGAVDFDGDGTDEILLTRTWPAPSQLVVVSSVDGSVVWQMPSATTDWFGGIRVGDLDGDGEEDLYVGTGMCGTGVSGPNGTAFSFCEDGTCSYGSARPLWNLTGGSGNCGNGGVLGDTDGDGADELVISWEHPTVGIYEAGTGAREGELPSFTGGDYNRGATRVMLENLDDDPALEVVTWTNSFNAGSGARRIAVFDWTGAAYALLWELVGTDRAADRVVMDGANSIGDLDGDGEMEVAVAHYVGSTGTWTTTVRHAMTGIVEATLPGDLTLVGVTDLTGDGTPELLARDGTSLTAFQIASSGTAAEHFSFADRVGVSVNDVARRPYELIPTRTFTMQLDDDVPEELIVGEADSDGNLVALHAYDADTGTPALLGSYRTPMGVSILVANEVGPMTRDYRQPVVATSDGYLLILDRAMVVTNRVISAEFEEPGMRVGGFYTGAQGPRSTALVGAFSDGTSVLTPDSRGALVRLDASAASPVSAPVVQDQIFGTRWASLLDVDGSGTNELVVFEGTDLVVRAGVPGLTELGRAAGAGLSGFRA
ncbi:MAG: VCBS repeat-containing protein, partial [Deltaproteobacteria bacterium]|nr:VCBS repeat-containing protein [Deltaproteobacteria bacterium]